MSDTKDYTDTSKLNKFQKFFFDYGKYHTNPTNIMIHLACIPLITLTLDRLIGNIAKDYFGFSFNPIYYFYLLIFPLYVYVDIPTGLFTSIIYPLLSYMLRDKSFELFGLTEMKLVFTLHIFGWVAQFLGHGIWEKRKPALMENIFFVLNAPVFVNIELFNHFLGYRGEDMEEVKKYIEVEVGIYRKSMNIK